MREPAPPRRRLRPDIGIDNIGILHRPARVVRELDAPDGVRFGLLQYLRVRFVTGRTAEQKAEGKFLRQLEPGIRDVIAVADIHDLLCRPKTSRFLEREDIGEYLAGMEEVRHRIDDGDAGTLRKLDAGLVTDRARHDDVIVPREDGSDIVHGFPGGNADGLLLQEYGMAAELGHPHLKGNARAERFFFKYQRDAPPGENRRIVEVAAFDPAGEHEDRRQLLRVPESERNEVLFHHSCSGCDRGMTGGGRCGRTNLTQHKREKPPGLTMASVCGGRNDHTTQRLD